MKPLTTMDRVPDAVRAADGVPLHRQLFLVLHDEIGRGALAPGGALPTEQSLCEQFGVSRITVRRALADLADAGLIERRQGVGSFVRESSSLAAAGVGSYADGMRQIQFETEVEVLDYGVRPPPRSIAETLTSAQPMLNILRLRRERRTGEPLMVTEAWLPAASAAAITTTALRSTALYELLAASGVIIDRMDHEMTAETAGPVNARLLDVPIGSALIRVNRVAHAGATPHHRLSITLSPMRSRVLVTDDGVAIAHDVGAQRRS